MQFCVFCGQGDFGEPDPFTRNMPGCVLRRPKRMWIWMKWFIICLIECSLGGRGSSSSTHALKGRVDARFHARFRKSCNNFFTAVRKKNTVAEKGFHSYFLWILKLQTLWGTVEPFRKVPFQNTPSQIQIKSLPTPSSFHVHTWTQSSEEGKSDLAYLISQGVCLAPWSTKAQL